MLQTGLNKPILWVIMMFCDFEASAHGKWILTGEHAVLRGHHALVFPLFSQQLILQYFSQESLTSWQHAELIHALLDKGFAFLELEKPIISGYFNIQSSIPISSGLGASAALSIAMARWFVAQGYTQTVQPLAQHLEDLFHGKSSGVDIYGCLSQTPIDYHKTKQEPFTPKWTPQWCLSYSGHQSPTKACVHQVEQLWLKDKSLAQDIDLKMQASTLQAKHALINPTANAQQELAEAIHTANNCFQQWGLLQGQLKQHIQMLINQGALAAKPTGSGGGGYVLSLWPDANSMPRTDNILRLL